MIVSTEMYNTKWGGYGILERRNGYFIGWSSKQQKKCFQTEGD